MVEKKIFEAFQMAPAVFELDQPGYLHFEEVQALKKVQMDFRTKCQDIALRYLKEHPSVVAAKNTANADVNRVEAATTADDPEVDLSPLFKVVRDGLNESIDREAGKSEWSRNVTRALLTIPSLLRIASAAFFAFILVVAVRDLILK